MPPLEERNRDRIELLKGRVEDLEELFDELTDDVLPALDEIEAKTDTMLQIQELVNPETVEEARQQVQEKER